MNKERLLKDCGIRNVGNVHWNLSVPRLYEEALKNGEGEIVSGGPLVTNTGMHTGRSPNDKFIVKENSTQDEIWWGKVNRPISEEKFDQLHQKVLSYLQGKTLYVRDCYAGAAPEYKISVRIVNTFAWHNIFIGSLLLPPETNNFPEDYQPDFTIIDVPEFQAISETDDTNSETFILVNFAKKLVLIGGTKYAGEMKKSVFTYLNYLLPKLDVFPMHCSANVGEDGDVAIFF